MGELLNDNEQRVLAYLRNACMWVPPTKIAADVGGKDRRGFYRHSAWASPICKRLVAKGLVERSTAGHYRAIK